MTQALIFDSGVGGLSVVSEIRSLIPDLHLTYVADDMFRPYGSKTEAQLRERLPALLRVLELTTQPELIIVPAIKPAAQTTKSGHIAVLGTPGTVKRRYVNGLIETFAPDCEVVMHGSVALVEQAERKLVGGSVDMSVIKHELRSIFNQGSQVDTVVLACTHFPLIREELASCAPGSVKWIDSGTAIARRVLSVVKDKNISPRRSGLETALLIGPNPSDARREAFAKFDFLKVVGLKPDI